MITETTRAINWIIVTIAVASFIAGSLGWYRYHLDLELEIDLWLALFNGLQLFTMNSSFPTAEVPLALNIARFTSPASLAGAIINGLFFLTRNNYQYLRIRLRFDDHIIICGASVRARALVADLLRKGGERLVVVDARPDLEAVDELRGKNVVLLGGNPAGGDTLLRAGLRRARVVLLLDDDDKNLLVLESLKRLRFEGKVALHLSDRRTADLYKEMSKRSGISDLHVISDRDILASRAIDRYCPDQLVSLDHLSDPPAHVLIAGEHPVLTCLVRETGLMYHFANLKKTKCTCLVPNPSRFSDILAQEMPNLCEVLDMQIVGYGELRRLGESGALDDLSLGLLCCADYAHGLDLSRRIRQVLFKCFGSIDSPRLVLLEALSEERSPVSAEMLEKLVPIGVEYFEGWSEFSAKTVLHDTERYDILAKHIHNSFSLQSDQATHEAESMWRALSDAERDYNRWPARHFHLKLRLLGARIVELNEEGAEEDLSSLDEEVRLRLARMEKRRWDAEKWITGFVPGEYQVDKDLETQLKRELKYHPALRPWEDISEDERAKDTYAFNDIQRILQSAGLKVVKAA